MPLPEFDGPDGSEKEVLARFAELRSWFAPAAAGAGGAELSSRYAWTVRLDNGMSVALGRERDQTTLKRRGCTGWWGFTRSWRPGAGRIDTIDMRYQNGLALAPPD
jgi:cell division protein FtsQ